jgi:Flp pilus assembly protein TadG
MKRLVRPRRESGNSAIEFALVFGLLWLLLTGVFRLGYSIYVYERLVSALAGAARYAARVDFDAPSQTFLNPVKNMAVYGKPTAEGYAVALAPGLLPANIGVTWTTDAKGVPLTLTIKIVNYSVNALFQSFTWSGKPAITVRYAGAYKI